MTKPETQALIAQSLGALVRNAVEQTTVNDARTRARLLSRAAAESRVKWPRKWWLGMPALAAACAALLWWRAPRQLTYEVIGAAKTDAYVSAPADRAVGVQFSDDTLVQVEPSSQVRVEETSRRGARVLLERGTAAVHVIHRAGAQWTFAAGPFEVLVTGTRFDLAWDPNRGLFDLKLREGSVEVRGPLGGVVPLRGGEELHADMHTRTLTTTDSSASSQPASEKDSNTTGTANPLEDVAPPLVLPAASASSSNTSPSTAPPPAKPWSKLIAAGEFKELLRQAKERGVGNCARLCSASDLSALADAARYSGKTAIATQSLSSLRARFAGEPEGRAAAFLLGRLREGQGAASDARAWYGTYLSESPSGPYAAEALAGKMRVVATLEGKAAAVPLAEDYLRRYPTGVQSATARGILDSH
jgi:TolA-binding protein